MTSELLDDLQAHERTETRPWGYMQWLDSAQHDLTVKYIHIDEGQRTSLQVHQFKDELYVVVDGAGHVELDGIRERGNIVRVRPGQQHRVVGPLSYIEITTYDDDTDIKRIADDYGRA